jgi:putative ABC transport system permease protein
MSTLRLAWRNLWAQPLTGVLNLLLLTLGLVSVGFVLLARGALEHAFERDLSGIDLVVGAKGSPMQLILSGVFHIDQPTGNVALSEVKALERQPLVAEVIPLALGDTVGGFRIVGTTPAYLAHYQASFAQGTVWSAPMQAVLGAQAAARLGLGVGQRFVGAHGLGGGGHAHAASPYTVTGVLAPCGCVLDRLVLTATESVWQVHAHPAAAPAAADEHDHEHDHEHEPPKGAAPERDPTRDAHAAEPPREVTVALVRYRSPLAAAVLPRWVNTQTRMQAASPAVEVSRLLGLIGVGARVVEVLGAVLLASAGLSVFIALWNAVRARRADLALLRLLGAPPRRIAALLLAEALWLALLAAALALAATHGLLALAAWGTGAAGGAAELGALLPLRALATQWQSVEAVVPLLAAGVALLAAALPLAAAYRVDVAEALSGAESS